MKTARLPLALLTRMLCKFALVAMLLLAYPEPARAEHFCEFGQCTFHDPLYGGDWCFADGTVWCEGYCICQCFFERCSMVPI
jgi:hypothetical protein